ncbi:MAG TPA: aminoacyl-tRNA hydrolase [Thermoplasmata archaeon]|nr:aminoacyl-tRNA hydrolase [Thermoplasmata archaeon]
MPASRPRSREGTWKMVLVLRGELRLTAGKSAVQAAHAAVMLFQRARSRDAAALDAWLAQGQMKVALEVDTLAELEGLERQARAAGIATAWVEDAGFTEVPPGTRTCLGLGPAPSTALDPITGSLALL